MKPRLESDIVPTDLPRGLKYADLIAGNIVTSSPSVGQDELESGSAFSFRIEHATTSTSLALCDRLREDNLIYSHA